MDDKVQPFRQPLITATGIILGFILNFATSWVKAETSLSDRGAYLVGATMLIGIACLITVLYRALRMSYPRADAERYYNRTLLIFMIGVVSAFIGVIIDMFSNFVAI